MAETYAGVADHSSGKIGTAMSGITRWRAGQAQWDRVLGESPSELSPT